MSFSSGLLSDTRACRALVVLGSFDIWTILIGFVLHIERRKFFGQFSGNWRKLELRSFFLQVVNWLSLPVACIDLTESGNRNARVKEPPLLSSNENTNDAAQPLNTVARLLKAVSN